MSTISDISLDKYLIHKEAIRKLKTWITDFQQGKTKFMCSIIYGPPGSGKTTLGYNLFRYFKYDVVEFYPDHNKTHKVDMEKLEELVNGNNILMMINNKQKGVLFDDIEIGSSGERGFCSDIINLLEKYKKKKKFFKNPLVLTINEKICNKKTKTIDKYAEVIHLNRILPHELFKIGRYISLEQNIEIDDIQLRLISQECQGDIRSICQKLNNLGKPRKEILDWSILSSKDLEIKCLPTLEKYANPVIKTTLDNHEKLYYKDLLFMPAYIYENSYGVLNKTKCPKNKANKYYRKILNSLCDWAIIDSIYCSSFTTNLTCYNSYLAISIPLNHIRDLRQKYGFSQHYFKTSNLYSRVSQASFNGRSMCDLSSNLQISSNEFHLCTYILYLILKSEKKNSNIIISNYLKKSKISSQDLDRLLRYNCMSDVIEKQFGPKKRSNIRKLLNS